MGFPADAVHANPCPRRALWHSGTEAGSDQSMERHSVRPTWRSPFSRRQRVITAKKKLDLIWTVESTECDSLASGERVEMERSPILNSPND